MPSILKTPSTMNLLERDKKVVWHPFTQYHSEIDAIPIVKAEGVYLYDEEGNKYLDGISSWWVNVHGHGHPHLAKALSDQFKQIDHVIFAGVTHPKAVELSERILKKLPKHLSRVFFSDNGSTAVEVALKMALQSFFNKGEERPRILAFDGAYHGDTFGAMSVGARGVFNRAFESLMFEVDFVSPPTPGNEKKSMEELNAFLSENEYAAFIFEPLIQGSAGMIMHDADVLNEMITKCKSKGILTIADEIFTGFGRTGKFFATDHIKEDADIYCLSKGLTGGVMPLGLTVASEELFKKFISEDRTKTFFHGHSFTGNALSCAVACASLDIFDQKETFENIDRIAKKQAEFCTLLKQNKSFVNARVLGTILAVELNTDQNTSYFNEQREKIYGYFRDNGVILRPLGNVIYIVPPYCIENSELNKMYELIVQLPKILVNPA